jgi:phospholipid transport system substrate-binding protein
MEHPVEYRVMKKTSGWMIYDVLIEGVSMVKNYRQQFEDIVAKSGYDGLVETLKRKLSEPGE